MGYQDWQQQLAPAWLRNPKGALYMGALGLAKDTLIARLKQGIQQRLPGFALTDSLAQIGIDRGIDRSPAETAGAAGDLAYASRLRAAWKTWQWGGTPFGLLTALAKSGYASNAIFLQQNLWSWSLDADGALVSARLPQYAGGGPWGTRQALFDLGQPATVGGQTQSANAPLNAAARAGDAAGLIQNKRWARYALIFPSPLPSGWAPSTPLSSSTSPTVQQVDGIRKLITQWGPGASVCVGIVAISTGASLWGYPFRTFSTMPAWPTNGAGVTIWSPKVGSLT